jgi:hypothetical protein
MNSQLPCILFLFLFHFALCVSSIAHGQTSSLENTTQESIKSDSVSSNSQSLAKIPAGEILVKGAWSSASDSVTPVPEDGNVVKGVFTDPYFGMTYTLPLDWIQEYEGPPPSENGRYVLAQIEPPDTGKKPVPGSMLITAQDMFFTPLPAANAQELTYYIKDHLQADYRVEEPLTQANIAGHVFTFFAYWSPSAELHWYVLATEIRCHTVQIILTSRDTRLLQSLMSDLNKMKLPADASPTEGAGGGSVPTCIKDYARDENVIARVDPVFTERRFNSVPVRILIDKDGKVKHIHFISAFPDQAKAITDALAQWRFKPYREDGKPVEVETGIQFGSPPHKIVPSAAKSTVK